MNRLFRSTLLVVAVGLCLIPVGAQLSGAAQPPGEDNASSELPLHDRAAAAAEEYGRSHLADFAGIYVGTDGVVNAHFTRDLARHQAELRRRVPGEVGIKLHLSRYSLEALSEIQERLDRDRPQLASEAGIQLLMFGPDILRNKVRVVIEAADSEAEARLRERYGDAIHVVTGASPVPTSRQNDPPPFEGGIELNNVDETLTWYQCTSAFTMNSLWAPDQYYVSTAGHCYNLNNNVFHNVWRVGQVRHHHSMAWPNFDGAAIDVPHTSLAEASIFDTYPAKKWISAVAPYQSLGQVRCKSGAITGKTCGVIAFTGQTVCYPGYQCFYDMVIAENMHNWYGDSGAPVYHDSSYAGYAIADGIVSGIQTWPNGQIDTIYSDIQKMQSALFLSVVTVPVNL